MGRLRLGLFVVIISQFIQFSRLLFSLGGAFAAEPFPLSEVEIYARCYTKLTRQVPSESAPVFAELQAGRVRASDECMKLVDMAKFDAAGKLTDPANATARAVLRSFHDIHLSWFKSKSAEGGERADFAIRDFEEPALYLTRAMFGAQPYSSIVTSTNSLRGARIVDGSSINRFLQQDFLRYNQEEIDYGYGAESALTTRYPNWELIAGKYRAREEAYTFADNTLVSVGDLIGVEALSPLAMPPTRILGLSAVTPDSWKLAIEGYEKNYKIFVHAGGGILGSETYMLSNTNVSHLQVPSDYDVIHRRLAGRIFEDLLCHELPTLNIADVQGLVIPDSKHAFQRSTSCMQCHASLDPLAFTYRNQFWAKTGNPNQVGVGMTMIYRLPASDTHPIFAAQPPRGVLHYRPLLQGAPVIQNVNDIAGTGAAFAGSRDLYLCAAKKYYFEYTGIDVQLSSIEPTANAVRAFHQNEVIRLGDSLRSHQSLRRLVRDIFLSPAFTSRDFKRTEPK